MTEQPGDDNGQHAVIDVRAIVEEADDYTSHGDEQVIDDFRSLVDVLAVDEGDRVSCIQTDRYKISYMRKINNSLVFYLCGHIILALFRSAHATYQGRLCCYELFCVSRHLATATYGDITMQNMQVHYVTA